MAKTRPRQCKAWPNKSEMNPTANNSRAKARAGRDAACKYKAREGKESEGISSQGKW
jgi:hypothetical protein